jgi:hypothetical protein
MHSSTEHTEIQPQLLQLLMLRTNSRKWRIVIMISMLCVFIVVTLLQKCSGHRNNDSNKNSGTNSNSDSTTTTVQSSPPTAMPSATAAPTITNAPTLQPTNLLTFWNRLERLSSVKVIPPWPIGLYRVVHSQRHLVEGTGLYGKSGWEFTTFRTEPSSNKSPWMPITLRRRSYLVNHRASQQQDGVVKNITRLAQLTWKAQTGFIWYRLPWVLQEFRYTKTTEGWGITFDANKELLVSDGSNGFTYGMRTVPTCETSLFRHGAIPIDTPRGRAILTGEFVRPVARYWPISGNRMCVPRIDHGRDKSSGVRHVWCIQSIPSANVSSNLPLPKFQTKFCRWLENFWLHVSNSTLGVVNVILKYSLV